MNSFKTVGEALAHGYRALADHSASARLDTELLLSHITGKERVTLITYPELPLSDREVGEFLETLLRRADHEPVAYIVGYKEFWGINLKVNRAVLVPRPETELVVEEALKLSDKYQDPISILDLGTGSGAIAIALCAELIKMKRQVEVTAIDASESALQVCVENVKETGLDQYISTLNSNWFESIPATKFDLIVANPPYIAKGDTLISKELKHEPQDALYAGSDGLSDIRQIIAATPAHLRPGGHLLVEFGHSQAAVIAGLLTDRGFNYRIVNDLSVQPRVLVATPV